MNILVNGSSVSHGLETWPQYLQQLTGHNITNLALAGAGNTYVSESTIAELAEKKYNLALIMWVEHNRLDIKINDVENIFEDVKFTSLYQSQFTPDLVSRNAIQKDWVFSTAYLGKPPAENTNALFKGYYDYSDHNQRIFSSLIKIISLQSVLKTLNIPYIFMSFKPMVGLHRFPHLYGMLDWANIDRECFLHTLAVKNKMWNNEEHHPTAKAHQMYAEYLVQRIQQIS